MNPSPARPLPVTAPGPASMRTPSPICSYTNAGVPRTGMSRRFTWRRTTTPTCAGSTATATTAWVSHARRPMTRSRWRWAGPPSALGCGAASSPPNRLTPIRAHRTSHPRIPAGPAAGPDPAQPSHAMPTHARTRMNRPASVLLNPCEGHCDMTDPEQHQPGTTTSEQDGTLNLDGLPAVARPAGASDPVPERHSGLLSTAGSSPAPTGRAPRTVLSSGSGRDPLEVIKQAEYLMDTNKYVRARTLVHQHLAHLRAGGPAADPIMVLRAARVVVYCDPRGIDPATRAWAWSYYRVATRRHGPGRPRSVDAARRLVVVLRAGGHAEQLAAFFREAGDDYDPFRMYREALRVRISAAQVLHEMGGCTTALRQLDHSVLQWREATGGAHVEVALVLAMLHLPMMCGHPRQARRMLRRLPVLLPHAGVAELLLGVHRSATDHRSRAGHRRVCTIAVPIVDTISERRTFLAELRAATAGRALAELLDDDYLGYHPPPRDARERITVRTGSFPPTKSALAGKLHCGVLAVARLMHAADDAGQSRLIISSRIPDRVLATADGARPVSGRAGRPDSGPQPVHMVFQDAR